MGSAARRCGRLWPDTDQPDPGAQLVEAAAAVRGGRVDERALLKKSCACTYGVVVFRRISSCTRRFSAIALTLSLAFLTTAIDCSRSKPAGWRYDLPMPFIILRGMPELARYFSTASARCLDSCWL